MTLGTHARRVSSFSVLDLPRTNPIKTRTRTGVIRNLQELFGGTFRGL